MIRGVANQGRLNIKTWSNVQPAFTLLHGVYTYVNRLKSIANEAQLSVTEGKRVAVKAESGDTPASSQVFF